MKPVPFRIRRVRRETNDTFTIELAPMIHQWRATYRPGQFNMLYVFGVGEIPISISGDPAKADVLVHTTRVVGSVTRAMGKLRAGDVVGVRGPFGTAWPIEAAEGADVVIVTGGIGLAPLRPAICELLARRERYGRVVLLYGARTPEDILYRHELSRWSGRFDFDVFVTVDRATGRWRGHVGVVTHLVSRAPFDPLKALVFVCGPEIMMHYSVLELRRRGVSEDRIYVSLERNMKCAVGYCGHCQMGPLFVCKDGPVFRFDQIEPFFGVREL